ncbi:MAG TPA: hypothetical protein VN132_15605 [Bdellovibrio sp.]|nr:hypothetical protein [Bdellovibrio sp.]
MTKNIFKLAMVPIFAATMFNTQLTPARADDGNFVIAVLVLSVVGVSLGLSSDDKSAAQRRQIEEQKKLIQSLSARDLAEAQGHVTSMRNELGEDRFNQVVMAMAQWDSPQSLEWMLAIDGTATKKAYLAYKEIWEARSKAPTPGK